MGQDMSTTTSRQHDLDRFYALMDRLNAALGGYRYLRECNGKMDWPERGIYFFFEPGEYRNDGTQQRVVRVGTHAVSRGSRTTLWNRLITHRGTAAGTGNHRGSVFRLLVGSALIRQGAYPQSATARWGEGNSAGREIREKEKEIELDVSRYIGSMPFLWLEVDDEPGPASLRKYIERNAIALLSAVNGNPDAPSRTWMGYACPNPDMIESGLWNSDHVREPYDPAFLDILETQISHMASPSDELTENAPQERSDMKDEHPADPLWLATVTLRSETYKYPDDDPEKNRENNEDRFTALSRIITDLSHRYPGPGVVVFPGGYFHSGTDEVDAPENSYLRATVERVAGLINALPHHPAPIYAVIGIDGKVDLREGPSNRYDLNQVGVVVSRDGLVAFARKFYPTDAIEKNLVDCATDYLSFETALGKQWDRIFAIGEKKFYLAVCNDIKGLSREAKPEGVDYILNLVHGCYQRGDGPTGSYLVRVGFGTASQAWKCPVFGTVVFFRRDITEKWRSGMYYGSWDRNPIQCSTDENSILPECTLDPVALSHGSARVDVYHLDALAEQADAVRGVDTEKPRSPKRPSISRAHEPGSSQDERYHRLLSALKLIPGISVKEHKRAKIDIRGKNVIGYPGKSDLDLISLFKPTKGSKKGVKFYVFPYILATHLHTDERTITALVPHNAVAGPWRNGQHPGDRWIKGFFTNEEEVETFLDGIQSLYDGG